MKFTDIRIIDPILSILVAIFILINAFKNFKLIIDLFLEKTPKNINIKELKEHLLKIKNVEDVHHIHVWSIDGFSNCATMHVVATNDIEKVKKNIRKEIKEHGIGHVTIEIESKNEKCNELNCGIEEHYDIHHHHHH